MGGMSEFISNGIWMVVAFKQQREGERESKRKKNTRKINILGYRVDAWPTS